MTDETSLNDVFRFVQLRPRRPVDETLPIPLAADTPLVKRLAGAGSVSKRAETANAALEGGQIHGPADLPLGAEIVAAVAALRKVEGATTADLRAQLPDLPNARSARGFDAKVAALSDVLLATFFATRAFPADLRGLQDIYRVYHLPAGEDGDAPPLAPFLARSLLAPTIARKDESATPPPRVPTPAPGADREALTSAIRELVRMDRRELLVQPDERGGAVRDTTPFTLTAAARKTVSRETQAVLKNQGVDLAATPIDTAVQRLFADKWLVPAKIPHWPRPVVTAQSGITLPPAPGAALVQPAGVADLLVVKQQIKRYEGAEIAHIENVLIGEKKSRAHRQLERSEETTVNETENTRSSETELQSTDRFELNRESSKTIQNDHKQGFGLSLSGKYGPTVEFSNSFLVEDSSSTEDVSKNSSKYAKDVVSRSLERLTERVREVRTRTLIRETEETNLHELDNGPPHGTGKHINGVYQFLDKVYETQVFNYGIRQMFDFMIPEPASFFWYVEKHPTLDVDLPPPPQKLDLVCPNASYLSEDLAFALAAEYGADIDGMPAPYLLINSGAKHGEDNASESGQPRGVQRLELTVPAGYRPLRARVRGVALTDQNPVIAVTIGSERALWQPPAAGRVAVSGGYSLAHQPSLYLYLDAEPYALSAESKLGVSIVAYETATWSLDIVVVAQRTDEEEDRWRLASYKKIRGAYEDRVREHEQKVEQLRAEAEARAERENRMPFGAPPATNRQMVVTELRKHCLSMITQQRYDAFDATKDASPPYFDFAEAAAEGAYIRFFEQAFEWDQMQYVFYPYFWSRKATWVERFSKQEIDPVFLEFLRAGSARVVVPVRPGFEAAVSHFQETGKLWGGEGEPPRINSPLYVSIIDEIRERTGAPRGEIPVGEPWDNRVPTALVLVRPESDLPKWKRTAPKVWEWLPDEGN